MKTPLLATLATLMTVASCATCLRAEEADMVCLITFGTAIVQGVEETTVKLEYLPRLEAEQRVAAGQGAARIHSYPDPQAPDDSGRAACEAGVAITGP